MTQVEVLLTGATGFLGKVVLHELARRRAELGVDRVHLVVRAKRGASARARLADLGRSPALAPVAAWLGEHAQLVEADLAAADDPLVADEIEARLAHVTHVVHCAASVDFAQPPRDALAANVTSALRARDLAARLPAVVSFTSVSTAYVTPHRGDDAILAEALAPLPDPRGLVQAIAAGEHDAPESARRLLEQLGHPNSYTLTKSLAEHLLAEGAALPTSLVRPSIIGPSVRRPFAGWIDSRAAFALFAIMVGTGRMRAVIARPEARLDLVPVDEVAARVIADAFAPPTTSPVRIRHAVAGFEASATLALCRERIEGHFRRHPASGAGNGRVGVRYLGPDGLRYAAHHALQHRLRRVSRPVARELVATNRRFAYFTQNTFRFAVAEPAAGPAAAEPAAYLDLACAGIHQHLLGGDDRQVTLGGTAHPAGSAVAWALRQPHGSVLVRLVAIGVEAALRRMHAQVTFDLPSFEAARAERPADAVLLLAPSHRSMLDFVLVSYLCFARPDLALPLPAVAAAREFARLPLLGRVLRGLGAFYLDRGLGSEDKALTRAVDRLVREERALEVFVEGQRSRSRRFLPPRRGVLRSLQSTGRSVWVLPIAICYDHVPEEASFEAELRGAPKARFRVRDFLAWAARMRRGEIELGRVHLACGRPQRLDLRGDVAALADEVVGELRAASVVTLHALRTFLERHPALALEAEELAAALRRRGARVLAAPLRRAAVTRIAERCLRETWRSAFAIEAAAAFPRHPVLSHAAAAAEAVSGALDPPVAIDAGTDRAFLRAVFADAERDWLAVGRAVARAARQGEEAFVAESTAALAASIPDAFLPDVEDAVHDLLARGVLIRAPRSGALCLGARAADLAAWRSDLGGLA